MSLSIRPGRTSHNFFSVEDQDVFFSRSLLSTQEMDRERLGSSVVDQSWDLVTNNSNVTQTTVLAVNNLDVYLFDQMDSFDRIDSLPLETFISRIRNNR